MAEINGDKVGFLKKRRKPSGFIGDSLKTLTSFLADLNILDSVDLLKIFNASEFNC